MNTKAAAAPNNRYRVLTVVFNFLVEWGETLSPHGPMTPPKVPESTVPMVSEDDLRQLLAECDGRALEDLRDRTMLTALEHERRVA